MTSKILLCSRLIATLLAALICTTVIWAQTNVSSDDELRTAIQTNGANITVTADIDLSNSTLSIASGTTVTINLGGHTLDRKLKWRGEGGGQVITVREGATLNLSNGTLKNGWGGNAGGLSNESGTVNLTNVNITDCVGDDSGGGICNLGGTLTMTGGSITNNTCYDHGDPAGGGGLFNAEGATATLTGVTITGNEDMVCGGGGICNYGTLNLDGCTITGNKARTVGGGIWSGNEKHLLRMQGANIITDNTAAGVSSNLFMLERRWITLTGSITGSRIGITLDVAPNQFTNGYATYHNGEDPNTFFTCDRPETEYLDLIPNEPHVLYVGEIILKKKDLDGKVPYIERSWDSENQKVVTTVKTLTEEIGFNDTPTNETQYKKLPSSPETYLTLGTEGSELHEYYVAEGDELNIYALDIEGPNVHIILRDSAWLHLKNDIGVEPGNTVYFHAQSTGSFMGKLTAGSGIGGEIVDDGANIEIHGGNFDVQGNYSCAAIGGKYTTNGDITIYDGHIKATVGDDGGGAAGIGSGYGCQDYGNITIYGGKIEATGSAGIGGGSSCENGKLTIWDGAITAHGQGESAGIGSNQYSGDYGAGTITINGGYIRAYGDSHGAGIGGGDGIRGGTLNVNGGRVDAYGGTDAAGIGGGEGGNGGIVNITGGYVYAKGNDNGAGIGGGEDGNGADVTINGGVVIATAGGDQHAIGAGSGGDDNNSLSFADNLGVFITENLSRSQKANRVSDCRNNKYVRITDCAHGGATATIVDGEKHDISSCKWCYITGDEAHTFGDYGECPVCHLVSLANDADNSGVITHWAEAGDSHAVTLSGRKFWKDGSWNTLCLPFNLVLEGSPLEGATLKQLDVDGTHDTDKHTGYDEATGTLYLYFKNANSIEAGKPYIIKWASGSNITSPVFSNVTISNSVTEVESADHTLVFAGSYSPHAFTQENKSILFVGDGNKLYYPDGTGTTIGSCRAYFLLKGIEAGDSPSGVREFVMNFDEGEPTGIVDVRSQKKDVRSLMSEIYYDLQGRKIVNGKPTQKGVYINNGIKIVVK
jgi:hypothetical protein